MVRIVVIGNINVDLIAFLDDLPSLDEGREAREWKILPGGSGSNFAVASRSLGAEVELYAAIGTGHFSRSIVKRLEFLGVKVFGPLKEGEQSVVFIASTPKGKVMYSLKGVSHSLRPEELPEGFAADALHVATKPVEFVKKYIGKEKIVSYSPGSYVFEENHEIRSIAEKLDFLFLNEKEARKLESEGPIPLPRKALIITKGERGSLVITRSSKLAVSALHVERVVDTTGAGDVFAAAFLTTYLKTRDIVAAAKLASAAGAMAVTAPGGFVVLDRQTLEEAARRVSVEMR